MTKPTKLRSVHYNINGLHYRQRAYHRIMYLLCFKCVSLTLLPLYNFQLFIFIAHFFGILLSAGCRKSMSKFLNDPVAL